eukprot:4562687-Prymnesium_polylepis.1
MRETGCHEPFDFPFESAAAASHCVHSCSRTTFERPRDESSYRFDMKQVRNHRPPPSGRKPSGHTGNGQFLTPPSRK